MRTTRLNIFEALNFAANGVLVTPYDNSSIEALVFEKDRFHLMLTPTLEHPRRTKRMLDANDWPKLISLQWFAGDDRTVKGLF